ncbi:MAG: hypothetical protein QM817_07765 [Archangium sp.]
MARRKKTAAAKAIAPLRVPQVRTKVAAWEAEDEEEIELTEAEWAELERRAEQALLEPTIPVSVLLAAMTKSRLQHERLSRSSTRSRGGAKTGRPRHISSSANSARR